MNYSERPTRQNRVLSTLIWSFLLGGIALFLAVSYLPNIPYPAVLQLAALAMLVLATVLIGHLQTTYTYRIEDDPRGGEGHDFVVLQRKGRRETVVCRLGLEDVRQIEQQTPENRDALKQKYAAQHDTVHTYCVDFLPASSQYIRFDDGGDRVVIRLQASEKLVSILQNALPEEENA